MTHNTPLSPRPLQHLSATRPRVLSTAQLRAHGVGAAETDGHCRPGGSWQQLLPGVVLLHPGPPTSQERLHAVLLYAHRTRTGEAERTVPGIPQQPGAEDAEEAGGPRPVPEAEVMVTGLAALTLHGFTASPPLSSLDRIDVLVPRTRRLRSVGCARILRTSVLPLAERVTGVPVAPVPRALADAVAHLSDATTVRRLLTRPHVVDAVDALLAEGRTLAEERLYRMVAEYGLPDPVWNVDLRLPGGPQLGGVDAYWPQAAVAVELDTRAPRHGGAQGAARPEEEAAWSEYTRKREDLERLGVTVVHLTPKKLRDAPEQQATVVRTALMAAADRQPPAYIVVLPR
jgi:hypothetical protein